MLIILRHVNERYYKNENITAKHRLKDLISILKQSSRSRSETSLVRGFLSCFVFFSFAYKIINILFTAYSILKSMT